MGGQQGVLLVREGSLSQRSVADPGAFERANYMKALTNYAVPA